ncbi:glucocorticoid receptor-like (DNA-binding domain), partial [Auricularia subglabra TFB-10046 SS5]
MRTPSATATPRNPDGKTECSNCGATHTPLWRRGLNDELNCNACGLYCKLNFRSGQDGVRAGSRSGAGFADGDGVGPTEPVSCHNCHTTATPLWRKDEEGRTVCNACGLYSKLHGASRPLSMKSESIRKRAR